MPLPPIGRKFPDRSHRLKANPRDLCQRPAHLTTGGKPPHGPAPHIRDTAPGSLADLVHPATMTDSVRRATLNENQITQR